MIIGSRHAFFMHLLASIPGELCPGVSPGICTTIFINPPPNNNNNNNNKLMMMIMIINFIQCHNLQF